MLGRRFVGGLTIFSAEYSPANFNLNYVSFEKSDKLAAVEIRTGIAEQYSFWHISCKKIKWFCDRPAQITD